MKLILMAALALAACSSDSKAPVPQLKVEPIPPTDITAAMKGLNADAAPDAPRDMRAELKLPARKIDVTKILWRSEAEVSNEVGKGTKRPDGKYRHELGDGEWFLVVYDHGKSVAVEVMTARPGWGAFDGAMQDAVEDYFSTGRRADGTDQWAPIRGRKITVGDTFGGTGLGVYDREYIDGLEAKVEAETKKRKAEETKIAAMAHQVRVSFVTELASGLAENGMDLQFTLGDPDTTIRVVGGCNEKVLDLLVKLIGDNLRNVGFTLVVCANGNASKGL